MKVDIEFLYTGYCINIEKAVLKTGRWKIVRFPSLSVLIHHPIHGKILFDTGYSKHVFNETKCSPLTLYKILTPITFREEDSAAYQLRQRGIQPEAINFVIISHFHADHIGGLRDFPNARFLYPSTAYDAVKDLRGFSALHAAFIPGLIPKDFIERSEIIDNFPKIKLPYNEFQEGRDLFGDGTMVAIELPGHARGQIGLLLNTNTDGMTFLVADASWTSAAIRNNTPPNWLGKLVLADYSAFLKTLELLHQFHKEYPEVKIVPTHCEEIFSSKKAGKS